MKKTVLQTSILAVFATDSKTTKYLEKRLDLNDEDFILAAIRQRPTNKKLNAFLSDRRIHLENTVPHETEEDSNASWDAVDSELEEDEVVAISDPDEEAVYNHYKIINSLREIFSKDTGTLKRINKNYMNGIDQEELILIAQKARPKNKKVLELLHSFRYPNEETKEVLDNNGEELLDEPTFDPEKDNDEMVVTEGSGKYTDVKIGDIKKSEDLGKTKAVEESFDVRKKLLDIFSTDKGTHKSIIKKIDQNIGDDDLIEMCLVRRPKNAKLKVMMKEFADFREDEDDAREFDEDDSIVADYEVKAQMKIDTIPFVQNDDKNLTMFINGEMEVINDEHPNFEKIVVCLEKEDWNSVIPLLDIRRGIANLVYKQLEFKNDTLYHKGKELDGALVDFIIGMVHSGEKDIQPFMRFLHKLLKNPSKRAQKELYGFLASGKIPINSRGNILTYKRIKEDWTDCHSGKFNNSIGEVVSMERANVDDRSNVTCSQGLHVCSYSYLSSFGGGRTVVCEVNPVDVVSIPSDYSNAKMRCCKYTVLKEVKNNGSDVLSENPIYF